MDGALLQTLYQRMYTVRLLEPLLAQYQRQGQIKGPIHTCEGQEAVGVGVAALLRDSDMVTSTHRGHAHYIGKGLELKPLLAEIFGRRTGYCRGYGGHMLVACREKGLLGGNGIVGGAIPLAVGYAWALKRQGQGNVTVCFFGDGATNEGTFNEAMNMASLWQLPLIFVLENNQYGLTVPLRTHAAHPDMGRRAYGYDMPLQTVDGNDLAAVYEAAATAVTRARGGDGPTLLECKTYRQKGFSTTDIGGYQSPEEITEWYKQDPVPRARAMLVAAGTGEVEVAALEALCRQELEAAAAEAAQSPWPDPQEFLAWVGRERHD